MNIRWTIDDTVVSYSVRIWQEVTRIGQLSHYQWQRCRPKGCFRRADNRQLRIGNVSFTVYTISGSALTSVTIFEFITSYRMYTYTGPTNYNGNSSRWTTPLRFRSKAMRRTLDKHTSNKRRMSTGWKTPIFISCLLLLSTSIDYGYIPPKTWVSQVKQVNLDLAIWGAEPPGQLTVLVADTLLKLIDVPPKRWACRDVDDPPPGKLNRFNRSRKDMGLLWFILYMEGTTKNVFNIFNII